MCATELESSVVPYTFAIVGVQKAGTSTLARLVRKHPMIARPPVKELHFFDDELRSWDPPDYGEYHAVRSGPKEVMAGDATPRYLFHPLALRRMYEYDPGMRLIAVFRDPVERLFSQWAMDRRRRSSCPDWPEFITRLRPAQLPVGFPQGWQPRKWLNSSGVARGYYAQQLERGFEVFDPTSWLLLEFREMLRDHVTALNRITDHLGIARFKKHPPLRHAHKGPELVPGTAPTRAEIAALAELYRSDLTRFAELSGIDVSMWPTRRILDGDLDPAQLAADLARRVEPSTERR